MQITMCAHEFVSYISVFSELIPKQKVTLHEEGKGKVVKLEFFLTVAHSSLGIPYRISG